MSDLVRRLAGKRIFRSTGTPEGHITLIKECGRVVGVPRLDAVDDRDLDEVDQVGLHHADARRLGIEAG